MEKEIKLTLAAEDFSNCYGILVIEDGNHMLEIEQSKIPNSLLYQLKKWYSEYYQYTGMNIVELKSYRKHTNQLDNIGIKLLHEIHKSGIFNHLNINRYVYYSRGLDKSILELE